MDEDREWSSAGLPRPEALALWRQWAARTIASIEVTIFDPEVFAAGWISRSLGQLRLLLLDAPAQRVVHTGHEMRARPSIQLIYVLSGTIRVTMGGRRFLLEPGQLVLFDNALFYEMEMETPNRALDVMMPQAWLDRYVPDPGRLLQRPIDARDGWAAPLGALLRCLSDGMAAGPLPRTVLAEHVGSLLAVATDAAAATEADPPQRRHRARLVREILSIIEHDHGDPALSAAIVGERCGISRSYVQVLLREIGTSFVGELNAIRLERAAAMLGDPRSQALPVGEIAYRVGFLDPGYFTRLFRKRFGTAPRDWRGRAGPLPSGQENVR